LINARHTIKNSATEPEGKKETVGRWQMANGRKAEKQRAEKQRAEKQRKTRRNEKTQKQKNRATKSGAIGCWVFSERKRRGDASVNHRLLHLKVRNDDILN